MASIVKTKGVDISSHNGDINLKKVKEAGYRWVMIRCGFGDDSSEQDDYQFEANVRKAEALGMPWGAYFYTYSLSPDQDKSELKHILRLLKGKKPTLPIAIDVEDADNYKRNNGGWNFKNVNRNTKFLLKGLKKAGYYPILYTGFEEIYNLISKSIWNHYDMWFAHWATHCGYTGKNLTMWQYGGEDNFIDGNTIPGVYGSIDKDMIYKDYPTIIKEKGYNNWKKKKKISFKRKGALYGKDFKDLVGGSSKPKVHLTKGSKVYFISDKKNGWSKVEYLGKIYYALNSNLKKIGLSKCKTVTLKHTYKGFHIANDNTKGAAINIKKGTKAKVICPIKEGKYADWTYCKIKGQKYYIKAKLG